jgi:hypothetical protein
MLRLPPQEGFQNAPLKSPLRDPPACHWTARLSKSIAHIKNAALQLPIKFKSVKDVLAQTVKDVLALLLVSDNVPLTVQGLCHL